jgi:hypothetical protein
MIIGRFKAQCRPEHTEEMAKIIAAQVFASRQAPDRQDAQPEVAALLDLVNAGALTGDDEWTVWETSE